MPSEQVKKPASFLDGHTGLTVSMFLTVGLVLRVLALLDLKKTPYFDHLILDEKLYHTWAAKIASGTYASSSLYEASPLPAYVIAFLYGLFRPDPIYFRMLNIGLGVLTCYLVYLIGKELANRKVGLAACALACLYKPLIFYSIVPLKTAMAVFLFALTIYLFLALHERTSPMPILFLGISAGLLLNVRPNSLVLIPIMPLLLILAWRRQGAFRRTWTVPLVLYGTGFCLALSPFVVRNYRVAGKWALMPSQSGFNLYLGNNLANADPYYRPVPFASSSPSLQGIQFTVEASRRAGTKMSSEEASRYWTREVLSMAQANPRAFIKKLWLKTLVLFNQFEAGDHYQIDFMANFMPFLKIPFLGLWLILPLGLAGIGVTALESRKSLALAIIILIYAGTLIVFFCNTRYRLPLVTGLIPFSVAGLERLWFFIKQRNWKRTTLYAAAVEGFFMIEFLPVTATDDLTPYYNIHGIVLSEKSQEEAMRYWEKSSQMAKPTSAFADLSLAGIYLGKKDSSMATFHLNKIHENSFAAARKYELMGDILAGLNQPEKAVSSYERSLQINSAQLGVYKKLIRIYEKTDPEKAKKARNQQEYVASFYESSF